MDPPVLSQSSTPANRIITLNLEPNDPQRLANLCGQRDEHLKLIEARLGVTLRNRGNTFQLAGPEHRVKAASNVVEHLYREAEASELTPDTVHLFLQESGLEALEEEEAGSNGGDDVLIRTPKALIKPRGFNQQATSRASGAMTSISASARPVPARLTWPSPPPWKRSTSRKCAASCWCARPSRPARSSAFCPATWPEDRPYLRPLYDALYEMIGFEQVAKLIERQIIEIAPLATCEAARSTMPSSFSTRARTPLVSR